LIATAALLAGCSQTEEPASVTDDGGVRFSAQFNDISRATETSFENGDVIGVFAIEEQDGSAPALQPRGNFADNRRYSYSGGYFTPNTDQAINVTDGQKLAYVAVYPYVPNAADKFDFSVNVNQNTHQSLTESDLATAVSQATDAKEVDLTFSHRLSHIIVKVEGGNIATASGMTLNNVQRKAAVDLNANSFTGAGDVGDVVCYERATVTFEAIIAPQTVRAGTQMITVSFTNGQKATLTLREDVVYRSGREYSYTLTVNDNQELVVLSGDINPWDSDNSFSERYFSVEGSDFFQSEIPSGNTSAPFSINFHNQALAGGMNIITITSQTRFRYFYVGLSDGLGYWRVPVTPSGTSTYSYTFNINYGLGFSSHMVMYISGETVNGGITSLKQLEIDHVDSEIGDLNVNLTFSTPKDVDLHLYTPSGEHIYFGNRGGETTIGGITYTYGLDHDSNAGCYIDNLNNENIYLPSALIEPGEYRVVVNLYSNCNRSYDCKWSVAVRYKGRLVANTLSYGNPASGVYAPGASDNDKTTVMRFTILEAGSGRSTASPFSRMESVTAAPLSDAERWKIECDDL